MIITTKPGVAEYSPALIFRSVRKIIIIVNAVELNLTYIDVE